MTTNLNRCFREANKSVLLVVLLGTAPSWAQTSRTPGGSLPRAQKSLREYGEEGKRAYRTGQYDQAVAAFEAAYTIKPEPLFLFNMAQARRLSGRNQEALQLYERYLQNDPGSELREKTEGYIAEVKTKLALARPAKEPGLPTSGGTETPLLKSSALSNALLAAQPSTSRPIYKRWWFWTSVGVAVAGATIAAGLTVYAHPPDVSDAAKVRPFTN